MLNWFSLSDAECYIHEFKVDGAGSDSKLQEDQIIYDVDYPGLDSETFALLFSMSEDGLSISPASLPDEYKS